MRKKYDIIYLPLHRMIGNVIGSEVYWALNAFRSVSSIYKAKAYVGTLSNIAIETLRETSEAIKSYSIRGEKTVLNDTRFYLSLLWTGVKASYSTRLVHHYGSFGFLKGFNPAFFLPKLGRRFIIGPILYPTKDPPNVLVELGFIKHQHNYGGIMNAIFKILHILTLLRADSIIFDCDATKKIYIDLFPFIERKKIMIIPGGGISSSDFYENVNRLQGGNIVLGVASNLLERKHIDKLIEALYHIDNGVSLKIAGEGPELDHLISVTKRLSLENRVAFLGRVNHSSIVNFYNSIDVYVALDDVPSEVKISVQEAMMCGCAVISGESGTSDTILKKDWGYIVDPTSIKNIVAAINMLSTDRQTLAEFNAQSLKFSHQHFSSSAIMDRMKLLYAEIGYT